MSGNSLPKPLNTLATNASAVEHIKDRSNYLRGNLVTDFHNPITAAITIQRTTPPGMSKTGTSCVTTSTSNQALAA